MSRCRRGPWRGRPYRALGLGFAVALTTLAFAGPASARIVNVSDGLLLPGGENLTVGSVQDAPSAPVQPAVFRQSPSGALQATYRLSLQSGTLVDAQFADGHVFVLHNPFGGGFQLVRLDPLTGAVICAGPIIPAEGNAMIVLDHVFVVGADTVNGTDKEKALLRLDKADCQLEPDPDAGDPFEADPATPAEVTLDPTTGNDELEDVKADGDTLLTAGEEGSGGLLEFEFFDFAGNLVGGFTVNPPGTGSVSVEDLEIDPGSDGDMDPDDFMYAVGGVDSMGLAVGREFDGGIPSICPTDPTVDPDADGILFRDIRPGMNFDVLTDGIQYPGMGWVVLGNSLTLPDDIDSFINFYDLAFCDPAAGYVELHPGFRSSFGAGLERPSGSLVNAFGSLTNDPAVEVLGFKSQRTVPGLATTPYSTQLINPFPGQPTPTDGEPSGGGAIPGDFDLDGDVDAADFVVWRNSLVTEKGVRVDLRTPADSRIDATDSFRDYQVWRANFGRTSSAQRRRPKAIVFARGTRTVRGGQRKRVRIPLTRAGKRLLRRYRGRRLRATVTLRVRHRPASGTAKTRTFRRTLRVRVQRKRR